MTRQPLIIDSGVAVKWVLTEPDSAQAILIYQDYRSGVFELLAPDLIYAEFGNIVWKKQVFHGFDAADAEFAVKKFQKIVFQITPSVALFDAALQISVKHKGSFYDSLYLALAERENCRFVAADEKLYNAVRGDFANVVLLANWK